MAPCPPARIARVTPVALAVALGVLCHVARAQSTPEWRRDLADALSEAKEKHKLLLICFLSDTGANAAYSDQKCLKVLAGVVPVVASPDEHAETDGVCVRFGWIACADHRALEKQARRHLFGERRGPIACEHVLVYPSGGVAWHGVADVPAAKLIREIKLAEATLKKNRRTQIAAQLKRFRVLAAGAVDDPERYVLLSTTVWQATEDVFPKMMARVHDVGLAERLMRGLAGAWPERAEPRLLAVRDSCHKSLRPVVDELLTQVRARAQPPDEDSEGPAPISVLGAPETIPAVAFIDGVKHDLGGEEGKVTVLLFFLPKDKHIEAQVLRWNGFMERMSDQPVKAVALGASLVPETELSVTRGLGFKFPAANFLYEQWAAPYGITRFPRAVVIDKKKQVVFNGDAYNGFESIVNRLLASK